MNFIQATQSITGYFGPSYARLGGCGGIEVESIFASHDKNVFMRVKTAGISDGPPDLSTAWYRVGGRGPGNVQPLHDRGDYFGEPALAVEEMLENLFHDYLPVILFLLEQEGRNLLRADGGWESEIIRQIDDTGETVTIARRVAGH